MSDCCSCSVDLPGGLACHVTVECDGLDYSYGKFEIDDERFPGITITNDHMRWSKLADILRSTEKLLGLDVAKALLQTALDAGVYTKEYARKELGLSNEPSLIRS